MVAKKRGGSHNNIFKELSVTNASDFQNYSRLPVDLFDSPLKKLMLLIQKQDDGIHMQWNSFEMKFIS
jgi:hypothetical protein